MSSRTVRFPFFPVEWNGWQHSFRDLLCVRVVSFLPARLKETYNQKKHWHELTFFTTSNKMYLKRYVTRLVNYLVSFFVCHNTDCMGNSEIKFDIFYIILHLRNVFGSMIMWLWY
jgi:hypothetical protein